MKQNVFVIATVFTTVECFLRGHIKGLQSLGFNVYVVSSPSDRGKSMANDLGFTFLPLKMARQISCYRDSLSLILLMGLILRHRPVMVHSHTPKGGLLGSVASWLCRVPVRIFTLHGSVGIGMSGLRARICRWTDWLTCLLSSSVWCVSPSLRQAAIENRICNSRKIVVIGQGSVCGVDFDKFNLNPEVQRQGRELKEKIFDSDSRVIGFVGRFNRDKGIPELLEAFSLVREKLENVRLLLVGDYDQAWTGLSGQSLDIGNDPSIHLAGKQANVVPFIAMLEVLVLPSHREGFGMVCIEASALQKPVVASRIVGIVDAVEDGVTGLLFRTGDAKDLAEKTLTILNDSALAKKLGFDGYRRTRELFDSTKIAQHVLARYRLELGIQDIKS